MSPLSPQSTAPIGSVEFAASATGAMRQTEA